MVGMPDCGRRIQGRLKFVGSRRRRLRPTDLLFRLAEREVLIDDLGLARDKSVKTRDGQTHTITGFTSLRRVLVDGQPQSLHPKRFAEL